MTRTVWPQRFAGPRDMRKTPIGWVLSVGHLNGGRVLPLRTLYNVPVHFTPGHNTPQHGSQTASNGFMVARCRVVLLSARWAKTATICREERRYVPEGIQTRERSPNISSISMHIITIFHAYIFHISHCYSG